MCDIIKMANAVKNGTGEERCIGYLHILYRYKDEHQEYVYNILDNTDMMLSEVPDLLTNERSSCVLYEYYSYSVSLQLDCKDGHVLSHDEGSHTGLTSLKYKESSNRLSPYNYIYETCMRVSRYICQSMHTVDARYGSYVSSAEYLMYC